MTDREKVICELSKFREEIRTCDSTTFVSASKVVRRMDLIDKAIDLLKGSFTPKEIYDIVIEHGQHDTRFKLGDKIDYSFTDVVDILNMELMCKAGDM